ncbi:MAG: nucleoside-diphosphate kinase [Bacteroidales bacterium]
MEKTLLLIKPSGVQRGLIGEVISRLEKKGLRVAGMKMMVMSEDLIKEHYAHLLDKPFFPKIKKSMTASPLIALCLEGAEAVDVVRKITGATNGREAAPGTIRGDLSSSISENIVHASDSKENADIEVKRFFRPEEIFEYRLATLDFLFASDEL